MSVWNSFKEYLFDTARIGDQLDTTAAEQNIRRNIYFRGPNVWILAFSIIIASVGLNINSTAVIIGAMLISPLMGPIVGVGLGLGINDTSLIGNAFRNLLIMVGISLLASCIYFLLSPLQLANPTELEARTSPSIYDVLIALFGGFAGILELARKEKGTVISGVAIATALMPPLCTAGYGLAHLNGHFFFGALGLFSINAIFITLATYMTTKYFHFRTVTYEDENVGKRKHAIITAAVLLVIIPSIWSAVKMIQNNNFVVASEEFISSDRVYGKSYIYDYSISKGRPNMLTLYLTGEPLKSDVKLEIVEKAGSFGIPSDKLTIVDKGISSGKDAVNPVVLGIYDRLERQLQQKDSIIISLQQQLNKAQAATPGNEPAADSLKSD